MRPLLLLAHLSLACAMACTPKAPRPAPPDAAASLDAGPALRPPTLPGDWGRTSAYDCAGGPSVVVREGENRIGLLLPGRAEVLPRVVAASGEKYQQGDLLFWRKGDEARLELGARSWTGCRSNPARAVWEDARLRGVDVRGLGQEPGWIVEVQEGETIFVLADYGERTVRLPAPVPVVADGVTTWHAKSEAHDVEVRLENRACTDVMSGQPYPATVTLVLDGKTYAGCGRRFD